MLLAAILALLTAAAVLVAIRPLISDRRRSDGGSTGHEQAVYRDQLGEIDRDLARQAIAPEEAESARTEIARRLLRAAERPAADPVSPAARPLRWATIAAVGAGIPMLSFALYLILGQPGLPGAPFAERMASAVTRGDLDAMIVQVEKYLEQNPNDAGGWRALAPAYRRQGRYAEAADAFARLARLSEPNADLLAELGEATFLAQKGLISADARKAFERALALQPKHPKAQFYLGVAEQQDGNPEAALRRWRGLLAEAAPDAPWRSTVEAQIAAAAGAGAPPLSQEQVEVGQNLAPAERRAMIEGMVARLAQRLDQDGRDIDGWLRLARARTILGQADAARAALRKAEEAFRDDQAARQRIEAARKELGLEG